MRWNGTGGVKYWFLALTLALIAVQPATSVAQSKGQRKRAQVGPAKQGGNDAKGALGQVDINAEFTKLLEKVRDKYKLPGMVAGAWKNGEPVGLAAVGLRKMGSTEAFTKDDIVHIGSCTKAMTATLVAMLIEEGKLDWDSTLEQIFPEQKDKMHEESRKVTLTQLMNHTSGLDQTVNWHRLKGNTDTECRMDVLSIMTSKAPKEPPGTKFEYSNAGVALAGLAAEKVTGEDWQTLMRKRLFEPLGMSTAGFGAPGSKDSVSQPWGHLRQGEKLGPIFGDNPSALGPAGTVHCSLSDWAKFAGMHIAGQNGESQLLKQETFKRLHKVGMNNYSCGWIEASRPWAKGPASMHNGSNTMWYATIWMAPKTKCAYLVATNCGDQATVAKACDEVTGLMINALPLLK